jgi:hypothetical protein
MSALPNMLGKPLVAGEAAGSASEQRDSERRSFIASIELFDLERGGSVLSGRTSDLSSGGCYVDCMSAIPLGSQFRVRIEHSGKILEAVGAVAYSSTCNGFGISFVYMSPQDQRTLNLWLRDLRGESAPVPNYHEMSDQPQFQRTEREILTELVSLLLKRGLLTVGDGNRLLRDLAAFCHSSR